MLAVLLDAAVRHSASDEEAEVGTVHRFALVCALLHSQSRLCRQQGRHAATRQTLAAHCMAGLSTILPPCVLFAGQQGAGRSGGCIAWPG